MPLLSSPESFLTRYWEIRQQKKIRGQASGDASRKCLMEKFTVKQKTSLRHGLFLPLASRQIEQGSRRNYCFGSKEAQATELFSDMMWLFLYR